MAAFRPSERSLSIEQLLFIGLHSSVQLQNAAETREVEMKILANFKQRKKLDEPRPVSHPSIPKWKEEKAFAITKLSEYSPAGLLPEVLEKHAMDTLRWVQDIDQKVTTRVEKKREAEENTIKRIHSVAAQVKEAERLSEVTLKPLSIDPEDFRNRVRNEIKKRREQSNESVALKSRIEALDQRIAQSRRQTGVSGNLSSSPLPPDVQRLVDELNSPSNRDLRYSSTSLGDTLTLDRLPPMEVLRRWGTKLIAREQDPILQSVKSRIEKHLEELLQNLVQEVEDLTKPGRNLTDWLTPGLGEVEECMVPWPSLRPDESDDCYEPEEGEIREYREPGEGLVLGDVKPFDSGDEAPKLAFSDGEYELEEGELPVGDRVQQVGRKEEKAFHSQAILQSVRDNWGSLIIDFPMDLADVDDLELGQVELNSRVPSPTRHCPSQAIRQRVSDSWGSLIVDFPMDLDDIDELEMGKSELDSRAPSLTRYWGQGLAHDGGDGSLSFDAGASNLTVESSPEINTTGTKAHSIQDQQGEDREIKTITRPSDTKDDCQTPRKSSETPVTPPDTLANVFRRPTWFLAFSTHRRISYSGE